jgi:myo-inositol-1(or 4)-monophosphatase
MEKFIKKIIKEAGDITLDLYGKVGIEYTKANIGDVVTKADLLSNNILLKQIKKRYPTHGIISEESQNHQDKANHVWIIDPLDGTRNFSTHTPLFGTMIALVHENQIEMAAIYMPYTNELLFAQKGRGCFLNDQKIKCSKTREFMHSYGCGTTDFKKGKTEFIESLAEVAKKKPFWMSGFGSIALCAAYVACGRRDWYASLKGKIWDHVPIVLILKESGCKVTNIQGRDWQMGDKEIISANKYLHKDLLNIAQKTINPK